ncbi:MULTISPECIES: MEDS domain-containing protein [unclassified Mesotoga]|jgi:HD-GYP domain-containing protein (c-di-GMP phosphodiesterase class II)|uniref:MEDS domain-containing protein n=1 Tax=unclassified Mesotoga TaxID=1184398 RepID=UPI0025F44189|nr:MULTISPECIES: MEDS domain-containing protein [unclassified Mesotoga]
MKFGSHNIALYNNSKAFRITLDSVLSEGLFNNAKILYLGAESEFTVLKKILLDRESSIDELLEAKSLELIETTQSYLKQGTFDPDSSIMFLEKAVMDALKEGFEGLCVAGIGTPIFESGARLEKLLEYEASVNDLVEEFPIAAICLYDTARMDRKNVLEISRLHPYVHRTGEFSMNDDYCSAPDRDIEFDIASRLDICRGTADSLLEMFKIKSIYVEAHEVNVSRLAVAIADEMGLDSFTKVCIEMAGKIHDIGMISLFLDMISRPGPLHSFELKLLQEHPRTGFELTKRVPFPDKVSNAILQHHERMDGSGYPDGLTGSEISLEGCILAVSEVVSAMSFYRPYRTTYGVKFALAEIAKNSGSLYHAGVVESCIAVFRKGFSFAENSTNY